MRSERGIKMSWQTQDRHTDLGPVCSQTLSLTFLSYRSKGPAIVFFSFTVRVHHAKKEAPRVVH